MADLNGETTVANASPECKKNKDCGARDYEGGSNNVGALKRLFSPSRLSGGQGFESGDSESRQGSTLASENSSKCHEADMQSSSVGVGSTQVKSEISTETLLTPGSGSLEMDMTKKKHRDHVVGGEDGLSTNTVESSCSNSLPVVVPVSFSYQSYQETSKDAYLFRNCGSSMDSSNSKAFDRSPEEPVTASSESGISAQIASKARSSTKIFSLGGNHSSSMINKRESETCHSWDLEAEVPKESDDVKCGSRETTAKHGMSGEGESVVATKGKTGSEVMDKYNDEIRVNESADSSIAKQGKKPVKGKDDKAIAGFDLNIDLNASELNNCDQPALPFVSPHSVIHVVAKPGIPSGRRPMMPLKFEGGLGWKGTAQTSAFRSTNNKPKDLQGFTGIDLNVAIEDDNISAYGTPTVRASTLQDSHPEADRKQAKSPWIDLNCVDNAAEEFPQPSIQPILESSPLVDLNLDTGRSNNGHWLGQASHFPNPGSRDFSFNRNVYLADLNTIQHMANNGHTLMASPQFLQRMELVPQHTLPSIVNQSRYFHEHGSLYNTPHPGQFVHEQISSSKNAAKLEPKTEDLLSASGSKSDRPRYFPFLSKESPMDESSLNQEAWHPASLKRKEPEGGLDCFHLGYKQLI
ncbi:hypothetical protein SASPL_147988 [Salvia splendens]|uniref:Uncharacterized protein n=1 Tax=Salvia splendens TaxID=180675 RepID=A0A8X8W9Y8_SALSN|nr:uncharacterized protein LOC121779638 [Salvia splendens]XP_042032927.1 uncharacterized protein LOC121779638 [Salvia splendens]XP_042032928.1 uncharacterized protein LOC121779638 [Salvia splendens]XP_042032929.1 uncharacterized protein LOC121779638 [Salvia splendens]KAG6390256.1 hypothetical protein SASPL_147988 [Salvia splendens]